MTLLRFGVVFVDMGRVVGDVIAVLDIRCFNERFWAFGVFFGAFDGSLNFVCC